MLQESGVNIDSRKMFLLGFLLSLVFGTIGAGLYFGHYFVVTVFAVWFLVEALIWRFPNVVRPAAAPTEVPAAPSGFAKLSALLPLHGTSDLESEIRLQERIAEIRFLGGLSNEESRWLERLKNLSELRSFAFGATLRGKKGFRQGMVVTHLKCERLQGLELPEDFSIQDLNEASMHVADLYWKMYETVIGGFSDLSEKAKDLIFELTGEKFDEVHHRHWIEKVTDTLRRDHGAPSLVFNLLKHDCIEVSRKVTQRLLSREVEIDEEVRSALYWMTEIFWFLREKTAPNMDFETSIRYLYHLCFVNPERAGFLEIDSQFFSQFENVSELAREGFLFKETLIEKVLDLWTDYSGLFDAQFTEVMETMTGEHSKIYDDYRSWLGYWAREQEHFGKDYLYVVEGNICFAKGFYTEAQSFYEKALEKTPNLRQANFNLLFTYARNRDMEKHEAHVKKLMSDSELKPASLYMVGNSYIMLGQYKEADIYYKELARLPEWKLKADYYRSTFCFEHGLYEKALEYAKAAHRANPGDSSVSYHLSLCYSVVGEKESALDIIKRVSDSLLSPSHAQWLKYYRFTLERDVGRSAEASETLRMIPSEYFDDPQELEEAMEFARGQRDLALLHHLRRGG